MERPDKMRHDDAEERPAKAINHLDGSLMGVTELVLAIVRTLPLEQQARLLDEFEKHATVAKTGMLNSGASDDLINAFDEFCALISQVHGRQLPPL